MPINSTEVSYGFGQLGSAYSDIAQEILPPKDHVIVAITFLADNTPTVLTSEKLDESGPSYISISGSTSDTILSADDIMNFNGIHTSRVSDEEHVVNTDITLLDVASPVSKIKIGQYVMVANVDATENGSTAITWDTAQTPFPIYSGPNKAGVKVIDYDNVSKVKLSSTITTSSEGLVFLDEQHGAGGLTAASQVFPKGTTIYGRSTVFKPSAAGVICYFGK